MPLVWGSYPLPPVPRQRQRISWVTHIVGQLEASHVCDVLTKCVLPIHLPEKEEDGASWGLLAAHRSGSPELLPLPLSQGTQGKPLPPHM